MWLFSPYNPHRLTGYMHLCVFFFFFFQVKPLVSSAPVLQLTLRVQKGIWMLHSRTANQSTVHKFKHDRIQVRVRWWEKRLWRARYTRQYVKHNEITRMTRPLRIGLLKVKAQVKTINLFPSQTNGLWVACALLYATVSIDVCANGWMACGFKPERMISGSSPGQDYLSLTCAIVPYRELL